MYILLACQHPNGGLRDKPTKSADFYHTCYALSGMAVSQYDVAGHTPMVGHVAANLLERTDIYYNVLLEKAERKCRYFQSSWAVLSGGFVSFYIAAPDCVTGTEAPWPEPPSWFDDFPIQSQIGVSDFPDGFFPKNVPMVSPSVSMVYG